jgi:hypothetical protein
MTARALVGIYRGPSMLRTLFAGSVHVQRLGQMVHLVLQRAVRPDLRRRSLSLGIIEV